MNRAVFAGLALVLLRNCDLAGPPRPSPGKVAGTWGGGDAGLIADGTGAHVHIGGTYGDVHQPIVADGMGHVHLPGVHGIPAHPVERGVLLPSSLGGWVF